MFAKRSFRCAPLSCVTKKAARTRKSERRTLVFQNRNTIDLIKTLPAPNSLCQYPGKKTGGTQDGVNREVTWALLRVGIHYFGDHHADRIWGGEDRGRRTVNWLPSPNRLSTSIRPLFASMNFFAMARPRPIPLLPVLVV